MTRHEMTKKAKMVMLFAYVQRGKGLLANYILIEFVVGVNGTIEN